MNSDPLVIDVFTAGDASWIRVDSVGVNGVSRDPTKLDARAADVPYVELKKRPLREGLVRECGDKLCTSLMSNPGVLATLDRFQTPAADTRHPIYVSIGQPEHENLPWEAMWRKAVEFFALGEHWPIARLASAANDTRQVERVIDDVPRIMAVIAAEDADVEGEWRGFEALLQDFGGEIDMHVMVSSDRLKTQIEAVAGPRRVQCSYVGETAADVTQKIRTYAPNIIHFFCHGTSQNGGSLSVINRLHETVQLRSEDLLPLSQSESLCLVVLNCCLGGSADPNDHAGSIARELVKAGLPAVVAMREIITDAAASVFTKAFYAELLTQLRACLAANAGGDDEPIAVPDETWLGALFYARRALKPDQPANALEWTLPLIYVRRGELLFKRRSHGDPRKVAKDDVLRSFHEGLLGHAGAEEFLKLVREKLNG